ncbi:MULTISPECIES: hypothetical protein [Flavobacterium]|uniref:Uncharacterized protein n=1 Tax=Flavobacterium panici TaxID=2654843 RepID=A0A9N8J6G1_9FLAO|nr:MULTISPECIES: hypothetical protein [Flavobacterium]KOP35999.1 hypothetical protein AKO67_22240 [Flavobacterium sp. VMW]OWU89680.1 hypothetical protein APR43_15920 [Flavobacterium sp. NLM]CAC9977064.1 hypothetical protein FLAPXU55_04796 [Flavobacterium panici]
MTKEEFLFHLNGASFVALKFAENYVKDKLTTDFKYNIIFTPPNVIGNMDQFDIYPEDEGIIRLNLTDKEVVELLYRKNKIPVWIDINVLKSSRKSTTFNLLCAGRYTDNKEEYYYNDNGSGPFGVKGPTFPIGYKEGKKFRLK